MCTYKMFLWYKTFCSYDMKLFTHHIIYIIRTILTTIILIIGGLDSIGGLDMTRLWKPFLMGVFGCKLSWKDLSLQIFN